MKALIFRLFIFLFGLVFFYMPTGFAFEVTAEINIAELDDVETSFSIIQAFNITEYSHFYLDNSYFDNSTASQKIQGSLDAGAYYFLYTSLIGVQVQPC